MLHSYRAFQTVITLRAKLSGAVYCNRSWLFVCVFVCGSVTTITRNFGYRSWPNWVCRQCSSRKWKGTGTLSAEVARIDAPREDEALQAPRASAAGARIETPKAPRECSGVWGGGWEGGCAPWEIFFDFGSQYGEFLCILDGIFYSSATCFTRKPGVQPLYAYKSRDGE